MKRIVVALDKGDALAEMTVVPEAIENVAVHIGDVEVEMNDAHPRIDDVRVDMNVLHDALDDDDVRRIDALVDKSALDAPTNALSPATIAVDVTIAVVPQHRNRLDVETKGPFVDTNALSLDGAVDDARVDVIPRPMNDGDARRDSLFLDSNALFVERSALDVNKAVALAHENDRPVTTKRVPAHFTRIEVGRLQSPIPSLVVTRYRNSTTVATGRPTIVVLACIVFGAWTQVLPASRLYCHS